jgi:hypothetical protein
MAILGINTSDDYWNMAATNIFVSQCTASATGNLDDLNIVFNGTPSGNMYLGVYADNGSDYSGSLLLDAGQIVIGAGTKTITGLTLAITNGVKYWLCAHTDSACGVRALNNQGATSTYGYSQVYGALPNPFPGGASANTWKWEIYGTITASSGENNVLYMTFES